MEKKNIFDQKLFSDIKKSIFFKTWKLRLNGVFGSKIDLFDLFYTFLYFFYTFLYYLNFKLNK